VLVARDHTDIAHLANPGVIERVLSSCRSEKVAYESALLTSGIVRIPNGGSESGVSFRITRLAMRPTVTK